MLHLSNPNVILVVSTWLEPCQKQNVGVLFRVYSPNYQPRIRKHVSVCSENPPPTNLLVYGNPEKYNFLKITCDVELTVRVVLHVVK